MDTRRWMLMLSLELLHLMPFGQGTTIITIEPANWYTDTTLTITCELPGVILSPMKFKKNGAVLYQCPLIGVSCSHVNTIGDYSSVDWSTPEKGIITIANANSTRDNGNWTCEGNTGLSETQVLEVTDAVCGKQLNISNGNVEYKGDTYRFTAEYTCKDGYSIEGNTATTCQANGSWSEVSTVCSAQTPAVLSVQNVVEGDTATFECSYSSITSTSLLEIRKDNASMYDCVNIAFACSAVSADSDYSDITFTGIGTTYGKGTFTVDNADEVRDGGSWVCKYGSSLESVPVAFDVKVSETNNEDLYWLLLLVLLLCVVLVIVIVIVSGHKTLVISMLYVKVTKNIVQLSWKPTFEHVSNTAYAKCAQNGLTENAEFIDGLFVVVFRELTPEKQHDVTIYCQNAVDMKLYKSEMCVVFTLKDYSNTNPKECNPVLALHSLDLTVYQKKVELSWTSPLAFDSTKVEYWVGSDKHITISANKHSLATSTAEMTRLIPGRMITFTITGEKDGTKYPSGILHQKTLKGLTDCCP